MNRKFPWIVMAVFTAYAVSTLLPRHHAPGQPDLEAFARLPVLHNGRVKPLDTIARTSLLMLRGKQTLRHDGRRLSAIRWLLDAISRPESADRYKIFQINDPDVLGLMAKQQTQDKYFSFEDMRPFLSTIREQAERAQQAEAQARSRFQGAIVNLHERLTLYLQLKNTLRVEGATDFSGEIVKYRASIAPGLKALEAHQKSTRFDLSSLQVLGGFFEKYQFLSRAAGFLPLPPLEGEPPEHWINVGDALLESLKSGEPHPGALHYARILDAYQKDDATSFNEDLDRYRAWLRSRVPREASRVRYEVVFNRMEPFYLGMVIYVTALLLIFCSWLGWARPLERSAYFLVLLAFSIHTLGLLSRIVLQGRPPVTNLYSSAIFVGWVAVLLGIVLERTHKKGLGTLGAAAIGFLTLIIAHHLAAQGDTMEMMRAVLDSNFWLGTHVVTITIGYSAAFLAGALAHIYILRNLWSAWDEEGKRALAQMTYGVVCFCLFFSFVGTVLGGIWADQSWGRFWGWDPKENGALLIVLWNAIILHARWGGYIRERGLMIMSVFGSAVTSFSWFGVNMLGIGLHSYGFMDKAFYWLAAFIVVQFGIMALGAAPAAALERLFRARRPA